MKPIKLIIITFFITACASAYKPTVKMQQYQASMNQQQALSVFHQTFNNKNIKINLCEIPYTTEKNKKPKATSQGYKIDAYRLGDLLRTEVVDGRKYNVYKKIYYTAEFNLKDVKTIRIRPNDDSINRIVYCKPELGDKKILLYTSNRIYTTIAIKNDELDRFLAAVSILAPEARLIEGLGF